MTTQRRTTGLQDISPALHDRVRPVPILQYSPIVGSRERTYLLDALESGITAAGSQVAAFEREMSERLGGRHAVATNTGTAALHLALRLADVGPGDSVLVPTLTFVASAAPIVYLGAKPTFIDVDPSSWTIDVELVEQELRDRARCGRLPKALIVVDLFGQPGDHDEINKLCRHYEVTVIEDSAESLGASYRGRPAGTLADLAILSFNSTATMASAGGGMLVARDRALADRARHLATEARQAVTHDEHWEIGYNYAMGDLVAAVGRAQLADLDDQVSCRRSVNAEYGRSLGDVAGLCFRPQPPDRTSSNWLTVMTVNEVAARLTRETLRLHLQAGGIESRPVCKPLHTQPVFAGDRHVRGAVAQRIFATGLCLPSGPGLSEQDQSRVIRAITHSPRR